MIEQGMSKSATGRALGVSGRTIYNWIASGELDRDPSDCTVRYGPKAARPSILDPYKETIDERLANHPQVSAMQLFREVQTAGYPGGYVKVKHYVRKVRPRALRDSGNRVTGPQQQ